MSTIQYMYIIVLTIRGGLGEGVWADRDRLYSFSST
jgi:hypothetical protein